LTFKCTLTKPNIAPIQLSATITEEFCLIKLIIGLLSMHSFASQALQNLMQSMKFYLLNFLLMQATYIHKPSPVF